MKKLLVAAFFASLWFSPAQAQSTGRVVSDCTAGVPNGYSIGSTSLMTMNAAGQACITGSITASLAAFHAEASLTPITATTGGVTSSSFTAGKATLVSNTGATNTAFCAPGASATTSSTPILPGQTVEIQTTSETQITCVTSTSTTTVSIQTGTGLAAGWGGSGAGGGGGAVTLASGAVASGAYSSGSIASGAFASGSIASGALASGSISNGASVAQGSTTDVPCTLPATSTACTEVATQKAIANAVNSAIPAGTNLIGKVGIDQTTPGTTNAVSPGTLAGGATFVKGTTAAMTGTAATQIIAAVTSKVIYVTRIKCNNSSGTATLVQITDGSAGTVLDTLAAGATYGGEQGTGPTPLFWTTSGNGLFAQDVTTSASVICTASGYSG